MFEMYVQVGNVGALDAQFVLVGVQEVKMSVQLTPESVQSPQKVS